MIELLGWSNQLTHSYNVWLYHFSTSLQTTIAGQSPSCKHTSSAVVVRSDTFQILTDCWHAHTHAHTRIFLQGVHRVLKEKLFSNVPNLIEFERQWTAIVAVCCVHSIHPHTPQPRPKTGSDTGWKSSMPKAGWGVGLYVNIIIVIIAEAR